MSDIVAVIRRSCVGIHKARTYCISGPEVVTIIGMAETMADVLGENLILNGIRKMRIAPATLS
jgi:hypothetical protein